ncbi:hypothetical protein BS50DRAFT_86137 [Corynespora cassiicola Philippines]|uniref:Uncharacterized protein n=1 Tax=Corynespora cassiicola Philippines TaxID=1448308 RepID=A0A2T2NE04_CORCC|nr:hypothetical protein BS50DRAFT_86137 [Corynespora cassiicola Philippines]
MHAPSYVPGCGFCRAGLGPCWLGRRGRMYAGVFVLGGGGGLVVDGEKHRDVRAQRETQTMERKADVRIRISSGRGV